MANKYELSVLAKDPVVVVFYSGLLLWVLFLFYVYLLKACGVMTRCGFCSYTAPCHECFRCSEKRPCWVCERVPGYSKPGCPGRIITQREELLYEIIRGRKTPYNSS